MAAADNGPDQGMEGVLEEADGQARAGDDSGYAASSSVSAQPPRAEDEPVNLLDRARLEQACHLAVTEAAGVEAPLPTTPPLKAGIGPGERDVSTPPTTPTVHGPGGTDEGESTPSAASFDGAAVLGLHQVSPNELLKWQDMVDEIGVSQFLRAHPDRFLRRVRRGVPPQFRWQVWKAAVHLQEHEDILAQDYQQLSKAEHAWTNTIEIDIARTFPELKCFAHEQQQQLWRVLNAYAAYNPKLGYCQGMNFVAGLLLLVSNFQEEESFRVLVCLMDHAGLAGFYGEKLPLFKRYLRACDMLVKETVPDLRQHFKKENVHAAVYLHQWFLTLFINCFPLSMVIIIWDVIICEGLEVVLRIAVSILQVLKDSLMAMHFEEIVKFFKMMKTYDDEDSDLNAFRIGQLLMKHTELIKVPQSILDDLRSDAADDCPLDTEESWEADSRDSGTWLAGFGRVMSFFNYTATKRKSGQPSPGGTPVLGPAPAPSGSASSSDGRQSRGGWEFL